METERGRATKTSNRTRWIYLMVSFQSDMGEPCLERMARDRMEWRKAAPDITDDSCHQPGSYKKNLGLSQTGDLRPHIIDNNSPCKYSLVLTY